MSTSAPNPEVSIAALWACYRTAQRDPELIHRQQARQHLHLVACACGNQTVRAMARVMLRAMIRQADGAAANPMEAPCA